eukprot:3001532-Alexandrium_andersonii.AAC.1
MELPLLEVVGGPRAAAPLPPGAGPAWRAARGSLYSFARNLPGHERFRVRSIAALWALARGPVARPSRATWGLLTDGVTLGDVPARVAAASDRSALGTI